MAEQLTAPCAVHRAGLLPRRARRAPPAAPAGRAALDADRHAGGRGGRVFDRTRCAYANACVCASPEVTRGVRPSQACCSARAPSSLGWTTAQPRTRAGTGAVGPLARRGDSCRSSSQTSPRTRTRLAWRSVSAVGRASANLQMHQFDSPCGCVLAVRVEGDDEVEAGSGGAVPQRWPPRGRTAVAASLIPDLRRHYGIVIMPAPLEPDPSVCEVESSSGLDDLGAAGAACNVSGAVREVEMTALGYTSVSEREQ